MFHTADAPSLDDGREGKSLTGFGSKDQAVLRFRTASLALRGAVRTRAEVLHDLTIVRSRWVFRSFHFLIPTSSRIRFNKYKLVMSGCVSAGKFMLPQNVFDPIADRVLSHESEQSLWMATPNCNFQF